MKIQKVVIEGFHNVLRKEYTFGDINYLYGRNGAGKSTVLQAIQLGLLGYVPGSNKTKQGVFSHSNNHTMAVKLILEDNGQIISIQRVWVKSKSSVSETVEVNPSTYDIKQLIADVELPLFNFDEFTHMTANTLKDWFINYLPKTSFKTDWGVQLQSAVSDLPASTVDSSLIQDSVSAISDFGLEGVEEVRQANAYFKNQLSFMKSELQRKTGTIQSLVHYDDYIAVYSEEELKEMIKSTEDEIVRASVAAQLKKRKEELSREAVSLESAESVLESVVPKYEALATSLSEVEEELPKKSAKVSALLAENASLQTIIDSNGICPYTQTSCASISGIRNSYIQKQYVLQKDIESATSDFNELKTRKESIQAELSKCTSQMHSLQHDVRRLQQIRAELESIGTDSSFVDIELLQEQLESYKEMYGKAVANRQYNELNGVIVQDKYRIENAIECLKLWVKLTDVNGLQASGGDCNPFDQLTDHINEVLKKLFENSTATCKFYSDGKSNSFSFGIERDSVYVPYTLLSSGEKCLFVLSMFVGLMNYNNSPLKLILIDDFLDHLDEENFRTVFRILDSQKDIQYIFAGVNEVPEDAEVRLIKIEK